MLNVWKDFVITIFGIMSSLIAVGVLFLLEKYCDISIYSLTVYYIIPFGAIGAGFIAASGYYVGALILNHRPSHVLLVNMIILSVATFFLSYAVYYHLATYNDQPISNFISYWQYLAYELEHLYVKSKYDTNGKIEYLGQVGYFIGLVQMVGFAIGAIFVYQYLSLEAYCNKCSCYFSKVGKKIKYLWEDSNLYRTLNDLADKISKGQLQEAINTHRSLGEAEQLASTETRVTMDLRNCKECDNYWLRMSVERKIQNSWKNVEHSCASAVSATLEPS